MKHWSMAGSHPQEYTSGIDSNVTYNGKNSAYIKSVVARPGGFGTLMQTFRADAYREKRMRFAAAVRSEALSDWAGLWMRVDGPRHNEVLTFDNMRQRAVTGTTGWQEYEVVLDVPAKAVMISFGILVEGGGQAWLSDARFEEVDAAVLVTASGKVRTYADTPGNLDFSET